MNSVQILCALILVTNTGVNVWLLTPANATGLTMESNVYLFAEMELCNPLSNVITTDLSHVVLAAD
jgi:hypothetical protein